jgi:hypothetical protein
MSRYLHIEYLITYVYLTSDLIEELREIMAQKKISNVHHVRCQKPSEPVHFTIPEGTPKAPRCGKHVELHVGSGAGRISRYLFAPAAILLSYLAVSFPTSRSYLSRYRTANRPVYPNSYTPTWNGIAANIAPHTHTCVYVVEITP